MGAAQTRHLNATEVARLRLHNQAISDPRFKRPQDVVRWLVAVQAQDYPGAKWAVAQRGRGMRDPDLDQALAGGTLLRTHLLRPTWHFVTREDVRWLLQLTAPRVHAASGFRYRQLGIDRPTLKQSHTVLAQALEGGRQLTRSELGTALRQAGIETEGQRLAYLVMAAELDGVVCSGGRRGKQFTYALLDERVPADRPFDRERALYDLTVRYFMSRGPANLRDFVWWSGLTMADAKHGVQMAADRLARVELDGEAFWLGRGTRPDLGGSRAAYLLSTYDEFWMGYQSRGVSIDPIHSKRILDRRSYTSTIVRDGRAIAAWRRTIQKAGVRVEVDPFAPLNGSERKAIGAAARQFGRFLGVPVVLD